MTHLVDCIVNGRVFGDVRIGLGNVGFRLVIIVVTDEIFDRIVREELLELLIELPGERLVVDQHERGFLHPLDYIGHCERLTGPRHTKQCLMLPASLETGHQFIDGFSLISARLEGSFELELWHVRRHSPLLYHVGRGGFTTGKRIVTTGSLRPRPS